MGAEGEDTTEMKAIRSSVFSLLRAGGERGRERRTAGKAMRLGRWATRFLRPSLFMAAVLALALVTMPSGCGGDPASRSKVREAEGLIESSKPLLDDLLGLNSRFNDLGTRFSDVNDTIAEGKSLAEMAMVVVDELEVRMNRAASLLGEVSETAAGDHAEYARLVLSALDPVSRALARNRELLSAVWDMLDLLPSAESAEQLSFYTGEIDRLTAEINALLREASGAAEEADRYREERGI